MDIFVIALLVVGLLAAIVIGYIYLQKDESITLTCDCGREFSVSRLAPDHVKERCPACSMPKRGY